MTARFPRQLIRPLMRQERGGGEKRIQQDSNFQNCIWHQRENDKKAPQLHNESRKKKRSVPTQSKNGPHDLCPHGLPVRQLARVDRMIAHDDASVEDLRSASKRSRFTAASPSARVLFNQPNYVLDKHQAIHKKMKSGGCDCWADNSPSGLRLRLFPVNKRR